MSLHLCDRDNASASWLIKNSAQTRRVNKRVRRFKFIVNVDLERVKPEFNCFIVQFQVSQENKGEKKQQKLVANLIISHSKLFYRMCVQYVYISWPLAFYRLAGVRVPCLNETDASEARKRTRHTLEL